MMRMKARAWQERTRDHFVEGAPDECWLWTGHCSPYGSIRLGGRGSRYETAHRAVYRVLVGPIPKGLYLDHLCRNPPCVNPAHLEPVTPGENLRRSPITLQAINLAKTHCPQGHPYDEVNTYARWTPSGPARGCRECKRAKERRAYWRRKRERLAL